MQYEFRLLFCDAGLSLTAVQTETTPIASALARHMGVTVTTEGKTPKNRYKIGIIIHGTPISGDCFYNLSHG